MNIASEIIQFELPIHLGCPQPTELRNLARDEVRLLVTTGSGLVEHTEFNQLDSYLQKGDVLVVNTSATRASALPIHLPDYRKGVVHFSTKINDNAESGSNKWLIEIREIENNKTVRWNEGVPEMEFQLTDGALLRLEKKFYKERELLHLWVANFITNQDHDVYLARYAQPIKYEKLDQQYPLDYYQTAFSFQSGSSEMPSAGRGFTPRLIEKLLKKGVVFAPILLHTGVSSLEENEKPYSEYMEISPVSATIINTAKTEGKRIIAVGTTATRAIESAANSEGIVLPYQGHTDLFIDEGYMMKVTNSLLTGFHEPRATHLNMLQSLAGFDHIESAYQSAIDKEYYWHQFGDLHLILP